MQSMDFDDDKYDEIDNFLKETLFREADEYEKTIENTDCPEPTEEEIQETYKKLLLRINEQDQK